MKGQYKQDTDLTNELREKYAPEGSDLRKAQMRMLELLKFLDKICKKHNLKYWLDSGTLLGAARHGGFIPWDDDTDVCMPLRDGLKLKEIMKNDVFDSHIVLQNVQTDPNYINSDWMTLRDTDIEYKQDSPAHNRLRYKGLQVDIFLVDKGVSGIAKFMIKWFQAVTVYIPMRKGSVLKFMRPFVNTFHSIIDKCMIPVGNVFSSKSDIYNYCLGIPFVIHHKESDIFPLRTITFEGIEFNCPNNYEKYLENLYGNWKRIPPENEIETHEVEFHHTNQ